MFLIQFWFALCCPINKINTRTAETELKPLVSTHNDKIYQLSANSFCLLGCLWLFFLHIFNSHFTFSHFLPDCWFTSLFLLNSSNIISCVSITLFVFIIYPVSLRQLLLVLLIFSYVCLPMSNSLSVSSIMNSG